MAETAEVVIVGAGFAGAATAHHLAERGVRSVLLLEREPVPGAHASGRNAALVFLGSCRGLSKVRALLDLAPAAHVFASRGVGTQAVNDPLLKDLNDELLRSDGDLDWPSFWRRQQSRIGGQAHFRDYLPPHLNPASILLRAYYRALDESYR